MHEGVCVASFPLKLEKLGKEGKGKKAILEEQVGKLDARTSCVGDPPCMGVALAIKGEEREINADHSRG